MSSYFVNSLFTKYKSGDTLRPNYYECGFAQDLGTRPTVVYGPGTGATFQHAPQIQEFYHHGASTLSAAPYQQSPCAVTCHAEPGNFYGYDALQRQTLFSAQDADLVQYSDCKLAAGGIGDETDNTEQSPSPTQLFPWMRPQGESSWTEKPANSRCVCSWKWHKPGLATRKKSQCNLGLESHFLCAREEGDNSRFYCFMVFETCESLYSLMTLP